MDFANLDEVGVMELSSSSLIRRARPLSEDRQSTPDNKHISELAYNSYRRE